MKKLFLLITAFSLFLFSACGQVGSDEKAEIISLGFNVDEGVDGPFHSVSDVMVVPDKELRTLQVEYRLTFPDRTEETIELDIQTDGIVGGDYFDRFEEILMILDNGIVELSDFEDMDGELSFFIERSDGLMEDYKFSLADDRNQVTEIVDYYYDITSLFKEEVY